MPVYPSRRTVDAETGDGLRGGLPAPGHRRPERSPRSGESRSRPCRAASPDASGSPSASTRSPARSRRRCGPASGCGPAGTARPGGHRGRAVRRAVRVGRCVQRRAQRRRRRRPPRRLLQALGSCRVARELRTCRRIRRRALAGRGDHGPSGCGAAGGGYVTATPGEGSPRSCPAGSGRARSGVYDLEVDTSRASPEDCAAAVARLLERAADGLRRLPERRAGFPPTVATTAEGLPHRVLPWPGAAFAVHAWPRARGGRHTSVRRVITLPSLSSAEAGWTRWCQRHQLRRAASGRRLCSFPIARREGAGPRQLTVSARPDLEGPWSGETQPKWAS